MPFFRNGGSTLHYLERGRGKPLLLIHGLGCSGADWAFQASALESNFRLIIPDLPGSGHSPPPSDAYDIPGFAGALWELTDYLGVEAPNIVGFSMGGAVGLEMATMRPERVPRLALINSLATYRPDHWSKWLEARLAATLIRYLGMPRAACMLAARLFPRPWQRRLREHTAAAVALIPASSYLGAGLALARWGAVDRLDRILSNVLIIAAENDFTPLAEKRSLAARLDAKFIVVRGSRHGTPFDSVDVTNESLLAFLTDRPLPPESRWISDPPARVAALTLAGSIAEEHALSTLMLD